MKDRYIKAHDHMRMTGFGNTEAEESVQPKNIAWLEKECPLYWRIDDVLLRDRMIPPHYVRQSGAGSRAHVFSSEQS